MTTAAADELSRIDLAAMFLRRAAAAPAAAAILGSGLGDALALDDAVEIPYEDIPGWPRARVPGHAGVLELGRLRDVPCALLRGRVHWYEGHREADVVFPVRVMARLGVKRLVVTNAAGGVNPAFRPGDLMAIRDHLNLSGFNPLRGPNLDDLGPRFPDLSAAYDAASVRAAAKRAKVPIREGVFAMLAGPSYETPAEVRMLRKMGADAAGMSTVPEVIAARHAGLRVAAVSLIANRAVGLSKTPLSHEEVMAVAAAARPKVGRLLAELLPPDSEGNRASRRVQNRGPRKR